MARSSEANSGAPGGQEKEGWRHFGDGIVGRFIAARIQGYSPTALGYVDVQVDVDGVVQTASSGGGGGGAVTIADGANVAQGSTTDLSSASTVVGILKAIKAAVTGTVAVSGTFWQATQPVSGTVAVSSAPTTAVTGPLTDTQLRAVAVPVSLASAPTTAVTGPLTDTQLRATPVPVSGTVTATTGGLTDTQLRATPVPVSGTVTATTGGLTDTQLRASAVPVSLATVPTHAVTMADGGSVAIGAVADVAYVSGSGTLVALLKGIFTKLSGSLAVTGTFWQATQPVSGTVAVSSAPTTAVTGTFFQATQPVSAAALPLPTGAATSASQSTVKAASTLAAATDTAQVVTQSPMRADASTLAVTNTAATGAACTLTIPAAAAGLFHYITMISFRLTATTARTGTAPILVTSTNLPGSPVWDFDTSQAVGTTIRENIVPGTPIKSSVAATATTIVAPIATTGLWRITAHYFTAP